MCVIRIFFIFIENIIEKKYLNLQVRRHKENLTQVNEESHLLSEKKRQVENEMIKVSQVALKRRLTIRQKTPSSLHPYNSEKLQSFLSERSHRRRGKETLDASNQIHGSSGEIIFEFIHELLYTCTIIKYCSLIRLILRIETGYGLSIYIFLIWIVIPGDF